MEQVRSKLRNEVFPSMGTQQIFLSSRSSLVTDMISQYMDPSILNYNLQVKFDGEDGADYGGLTSEAFSEFWRLIFFELLQ